MAPTAFYTLSLHDALPIFFAIAGALGARPRQVAALARSEAVVFGTVGGMLGIAGGVALAETLVKVLTRSEEHTSELQSQFHLVCRLLLDIKKVMQEGLLDA